METWPGGGKPEIPTNPQQPLPIEHNSPLHIAYSSKTVLKIQENRPNMTKHNNIHYQVVNKWKHVGVATEET